MAIGGFDPDLTLVAIESSARDPVSRWMNEPGDRFGSLIKSLSPSVVEWAGDDDQSRLDDFFRLEDFCFRRADRKSTSRQATAFIRALTLASRARSWILWLSRVGGVGTWISSKFRRLFQLGREST